MTDIDGNVYQTVTIGTQVWMAENLKVTHYRDGDTIPNVINNSAWEYLSSGGYCDYDNNPVNVAIYGRLYNWYAVSDARNIAPEGWHIPSHSEWQTLVLYLGSDAGGKMKETGTAHWSEPNTGATNESGFNALPAGMCGYMDLYIGMPQDTWFWSSTDYPNNRARVCELWSYSASAEISGHLAKGSGLSVRCVKD
ncbi:MAG: fibrobacter succinogenes major paralogous domain-containing protein [Candidatus Zixiibacteriota bacterium]